MTRDPQRLLAALAAGVTICLTGAGFWLSYAHLAALASSHGMATAPDRAWAWPACVDAFTLVGELLVLRAALAHRVDPYAIALTTLGSGGSIALNVASTGSGAPALDYVVSGVPPVAALLAFGALMRQLHERLVVHVPAGYAALPEVSVEPVEGLLEAVAGAPRVEGQEGVYSLPELPGVRPEESSAPASSGSWGAGSPGGYEQPLPEPAETVVTPPQQLGALAELEEEYIEPDPVPDPGEGTPDEVLAAAARVALAEHLEEGRLPSIRALRRELGIGQARAQRVQRLLTPA